MFKFLQPLVFAMVIGHPAASFAQFSDKGEHVEVKKGTTLCSSFAVEGVPRTADLRRTFWRVTSAMRVNGTQTVSALVHETVYDRQSGDTTTVESAYPDEQLATFFKRATGHNGMLQMISPQDGNLQAIVEVCQKGNRTDANALSALQGVHDYQPVERAVELREGRRVAVPPLR